MFIINLLTAIFWPKDPVNGTIKQKTTPIDKWLLLCDSERDLEKMEKVLNLWGFHEETITYFNTCWCDS